MNYEFYTLGDDAFTISFGNSMDTALNERLHRLQQVISAAQLPGVEEITIAYNSLSVYYDSCRILKDPSAPSAQATLLNSIRRIIAQPVTASLSFSGAIKKISVCCDDAVATDLESFCQEKEWSRSILIEKLCTPVYQVFMTGFLPGFPYMGILPEELYARRKTTPAAIKAGSVGIAGRQTGIYPVDSPGGWQILGATPLRIFNPDAENPCYLQAGDRVQYDPVSIDEYYHIKSGH